MYHSEAPPQVNVKTERNSKYGLGILTFFSIDDLLTLNDHPVFEKKIGKPSLNKHGNVWGIALF